MKIGHRELGFTMIELMIVLVVVAILAAIAYPAFTSQIQQGRRADAQQELMDMALRQEKWRANHTEYGTLPDIGHPCPGSGAQADACDYYDFGLNNRSATTYTLTATPKNSQASDKEGGVPCDPLELNQSDEKTPEECW